MAEQRRNDSLQKIDDIDILGIATKTATAVVKNRPISVSLWVVGLLVAAFANGFAVDEVREEAYTIALGHADEVDRKELSKALRHLQQAEERHYNLKGWFWQCDARCQQAADKVEMARAEAIRVQAKRDSLMTEARREVGIWSVFGVRDVRASFWAAWKSGKEFAARWTMMDAMFMMLPGGREESMIQVILKIVMQYIINLTMGLIGAFFYFIYNVYVLITSYGEPALSGIAFFLLVLVAGVATVGSYLIAIYGTVAGGGLYLVKQAAKQAAVEGGPDGRPRQRVQYHPQYGGRAGGMRSHYD